jgi:hypothetical protein
VGHLKRENSPETVAQQMIRAIAVLHSHRFNQGGSLAFHGLMACCRFGEPAGCCPDQRPIFSEQSDEFSVFFRTPFDVMNEEQRRSVGSSVQEQQRLPSDRIDRMDCMRSLREHVS